MTPQQAVVDLLAAGWTEQRIADEIKRGGVGCCQSTIHRIGAGKTANPGFALGAAILSLHDRVTKRRVA